MYEEEEDPPELIKEVDKVQVPLAGVYKGCDSCCIPDQPSDNTHWGTRCWQEHSSQLCMIYRCVSVGVAHKRQILTAHHDRKIAVIVNGQSNGFRCRLRMNLRVCRVRRDL